MAENILSISLKDYKKQIEELKGSLLNLQRGSEAYDKVLNEVQNRQNKLNQVMSDTKGKTEAAEGSVKEMRQALSELKKAWVETGDEMERKQLANQIKPLQDKLNDLHKSIGDYRYNIGNYANSFAEALNKMGLSFGGVIQGAMETGSAINKAFAKNPYITALAVAITALVGVFKVLKNAINSNEQTQRKWKEAMATMQPIINLFKNAIDKVAQAVVALVSKIMEYIPKGFKVIGEFVKNSGKRFADFIRSVGKIVSAVAGIVQPIAKVFGKVLEIVSAAVKKIAEPIASLLETVGLDGLASGLRNIANVGANVIATMAAGYENLKGNVEAMFNAMANGIETATAKVGDWSVNMGKAMETTRGLAKAQNDLAQQSRDTQTALAANNAEIAKLRDEMAKEKDPAKRAALLAKQQELIKKNGQMSYDLAKRTYEIESQIAELAPNSVEDNQRLVDLKTELYNTEAAMYQQLVKTDKQLTSIEGKENATGKAAKATAKSTKEAAEATKKRAELLKTAMKATENAAKQEKERATFQLQLLEAQGKLNASEVEKRKIEIAKQYNEQLKSQLEYLRELATNEKETSEARAEYAKRAAEMEAELFKSTYQVQIDEAKMTIKEIERIFKVNTAEIEASLDRETKRIDNYSKLIMAGFDPYKLDKEIGAFNEKFEQGERVSFGILRDWTVGVGREVTNLGGIWKYVGERDEYNYNRRAEIAERLGLPIRALKDVTTAWRLGTDDIEKAVVENNPLDFISKHLDKYSKSFMDDGTILELSKRVDDAFKKLIDVVLGENEIGVEIFNKVKDNLTSDNLNPVALLDLIQKELVNYSEEDASINQKALSILKQNLYASNDELRVIAADYRKYYESIGQAAVPNDLTGIIKKLENSHIYTTLLDELLNVGEGVRAKINEALIRLNEEQKINIFGENFQDLFSEPFEPRQLDGIIKGIVNNFEKIPEELKVNILKVGKEYRGYLETYFGKNGLPEIIKRFDEIYTSYNAQLTNDLMVQHNKMVEQARGNYEDAQRIRDKFNDLFKGMTVDMNRLASDNIMTFYGGFIREIKENLDKVTDELKPLVNKMYDELWNSTQPVADPEGFVENMKKIASELKSQGGDFEVIFKQVYDGIERISSQSFILQEDSFVGAFEKFIERFTKEAENLPDGLKPLWDGILEQFEGHLSDGFDIKAFSDNLNNFMNNVIETTDNAVTEARKKLDSFKGKGDFTTFRSLAMSIFGDDFGRVEDDIKKQISELNFDDIVKYLDAFKDEPFNKDIQDEIEAALNIWEQMFAEREKYANSVEALNEKIQEADLQLFRMQDEGVDPKSETYQNSLRARQKYIDELYQIDVDYVLNMNKLQEDLYKAQAKYAQKRIDNERKAKEMQQKIYMQLAQSVANLMGTMSEVLEEYIKEREKQGKISEEQAKKEFERVKILQIGETILNTIAGATGAFMSAMKEFPAPYGAIIGAIQAASATAAGAAQVAKIAHTEYGSTSASGAASTAGMTSAIYQGVTADPLLNETLDERNLSQLDIESRNTKEQRVYILQSDISDSESQVRIRQNQSTF